MPLIRISRPLRLSIELDCDLEREGDGLCVYDRTKNRYLVRNCCQKGITVDCATGMQLTISEAAISTH